MRFPTTVAGRIVLVLACLGAVSCGPQPESASWPVEAHENFRHFRKSLEERNASMQIRNSGAAFTAIPKEQIQAQLGHLKCALAEAERVRADVLTRAHPELPARWEQYRRGLGLMARNLELGDLEAEIEGSRLDDEFGNWFEAHGDRLEPTR